MKEEEIIPLIHIWMLYLDRVKEPLKNSLDSVTSAIQEAEQKKDLEQLEMATEYLMFIVNEVLRK
jgi:hypothetical protein